MKRRNFIKGMGLVGAAAYVDPLSLINSNSLLYPNQLWKPSVKALYTPTFSKFQLDKGKLDALVKQGVMDIQGDNLLFAWPFHVDSLVNDPGLFARCGGITNQEMIDLEWTQLENLGLKEIGSLTNNLLHNINPYRLLEWAVEQNDKQEHWTKPYWDYDDVGYTVKGLKISGGDKHDPYVYDASNQPVYSIPIKNFGQLVDYCSYQYHITYEYNFSMGQLCHNHETGEFHFWGNSPGIYPKEVMKVEEGNMISFRKRGWDEGRDEWSDPIKYKGCHRAHGCPEKKTGCYSEEKYGPGGKVDEYGICHRSHGGDYEIDTIEESLGYMQMIASPLSKQDNWEFGECPDVFYGDAAIW